MDIVIVTGISGSGKSVALNILEDLGYNCVDNLPPIMLGELVTTFVKEDNNMLATAIDARSATSLSSLPKAIRNLREQGHNVKILFLTADTNTLLMRFSETRRKHPLIQKGRAQTLSDAIQAERDILGDVETIGHQIDTTYLTANQLRDRVKTFVNAPAVPMTMTILSFSYRQGVPRNASLVFDVRSLPNPHYISELRPFTGQDRPVIDFLEKQPEVADMLNDIVNLVEKWLPAFKNDNRSYITIAIGCTGGQHRSVYMAEKLAAHLSKKENVLLRHTALN